MGLPRLTYTLNGVTYDTDPNTQGLAGVSVSTELESGQLFFRTKWVGSVTFSGVDFQRFWQAHLKTCCQTIFVSLYRTNTACSDTAPYWKGKFNLTDLDFNKDTCSASLATAPRPDDGYQTLLENWENQVNWLSFSSEFGLTSIYSTDRKILYRRGRLLTEVLAGMVRLTLTGTSAASLIPISGMDTVSVFLESNTNPVTRRANYLKGAVCLQASDVMAPGKVDFPATDFAVRAEISLKEVVDDMQALFCLYPYIEPVTGKLRWEHESFFPHLTYDPPAAGYSLPDESPYWNGKRIVKTDTSELYGKYELTIEPNQALSPPPSDDTSAFLFPVALNNPFGLPDVPLLVDDPTVPLDFSTGTITFDDTCIRRLPGETPLTKSVSVKRFATYFDATRTNPDAVQKADWIFLVEAAPAKNTAILIPQIAYGVLDTFSSNALNGNLSASSLVRDFHRHNKPFLEGYTNISSRYLPKGIRRGMLSVVPTRKLNPVTIPYCCADDPISLTGQIQTWYGPDANLVRASYQLAEEELTLEFMHPGPCQIKPPTPFDANGNPLPCPPKGTYIRMEQSAEYPDGNVTQFPCRVTVDLVYADGECGEYKVSSVTSNGLC